MGQICLIERATCTDRNAYGQTTASFILLFILLIILLTVTITFTFTCLARLAINIIIILGKTS